MMSKLEGRLHHDVNFLTWLILRLTLFAFLFATVIQPVRGTLVMPVQGTISQLTLSSSAILKTNSPSLVSSNGIFALGFFTSSSSATRFGLGIWYNIQLPAGIQTVVWMPQPDVNLSDAASLQLLPSGVLQLTDAVQGTRDQLVWSSSNNHPGTILELQDDGNLVLRSATSTVIWQSFDTPTDTLLPGQVLRATNSRPLVSWRGVDDWAKGSYFCALMPINNTMSLTLYWNGKSIDGWNQSSWSTTNLTIGNSNNTIYPYLISFPFSDYIYLDRANGSFYAGNESFSTLLMSSASSTQGPLRRVTLDRDGLLRLYSWTTNTNAWQVEGIWAPPGANGLCAVFAECGPYGLCTLDPSSPAYFATCSCPEGFELIDPYDQFKGCKRRYAIPPGVCVANTTKLIKAGEMDFPFASRLYPAEIMNETDCKHLCLNDCRCAGVVFWRRTGQCYIKSDPLFNGGFPQDIGNHSSYLKVLNSPLYSPGAHHRHMVDIITVTSVGVGAALVCLGMVLLAWKCWIQSQMKLHPKLVELDLLGMYPRKFTFRELSAATNSFCQSELIGSGGMGSVYKGALKPTGAIVAVKRIRHEARGSEEGFLAEACSISQIRHRNLVQLKGWCIEDGKLLLVYEYMSNGSLDQWLYDHRSDASSRRHQRSTAKELSWSLRYSILSQIAAALEYLHEDWQQCVLHRDIKSANVLLDAEFNAHLGDFGLARLIDHQKMEKTTLMAGTLGYMAPEIPYTGKATKETDVYSFGVLMLEVVCGKKPLDSSDAYDSLDEPGVVVLLHRVRRAYKDGNLLTTVDPRLKITRRDSNSNPFSKNPKQSKPDAAEADSSEDEIKAREEEQQTLVLKLGLLCCLPHPSARPSMRLVHRILVTGDAAAIPALPDTTQWTHLDVLEAAGSTSKGRYPSPRRPPPPVSSP
ncbi:hypothetical protein KC19_3G099500 [Ceratodon purpureus]|uniref:Receptor-like serine/threonine-protein kinase n=1 Tax=Ceratodon purpureus TaxID=3225 RepID=A0A8T0II52_CERPU|nr:hypothetical protein KC19_3G099500 [Ceratodon purpureus]